MTTATHNYRSADFNFACILLGSYDAGLSCEVLVEIADTDHKWHGKTLAVNSSDLEPIE